MNWVLESLWKSSYYGKQKEKDKPTKKDANLECWHITSEGMGSESKMAKFLNNIMDTVKQVIGRKFKAKQLVILLHIFHSSH